MTLLMRMISNALLALLALLATTLPSLAAAQVPQSVTAGPAPQSAARAPASATSTAVTDTGYVLGSGDVIEVSVVGREDYRARVKVQVDGTVPLPLIGSTKADGRTPLELSADVARALKSGGFFSNPVVSVDIATYSSRYVTVLGEVAQPGLVPIDRGYRTSEILARVGGVRESAADSITLRRSDGTEQQLAVVALATGGPAEDPVINPGDKLYVPTAKTFYIYGQVSAPGVYRLDTAMSLRKAIARGGGLTPSGSEKRVRVYRGGEEIKKFDLNANIGAGDVIVVGERLF